MKIYMLLVIWVSAAAHAQVYKCVDEAGATQFSDLPCGKTTEKVTIDAPASSGINMGASMVVSDDIKILEAQEYIYKIKEVFARRSEDYERQNAALAKKMQNLNLSDEERAELKHQMLDNTHMYFEEKKKFDRELSQAQLELWNAEKPSDP